MGLRYYIVGDEGLKRVSRKVISEQEPLPQFARSRMKVIQTYYERKGDRLLFDIRGTYIHFDKDGIVYVPDASMHNVAELIWVDREIERERLKTPKVANADLHRRIKKLKSESQWKPSKAEADAIAADLLGSARPPGTSSIPLMKPRKT
jgi:hypothetical protein